MHRRHLELKLLISKHIDLIDMICKEIVYIFAMQCACASTVSPDAPRFRPPTCRQPQTRTSIGKTCACLSSVRDHQRVFCLSASYGEKTKSKSPAAVMQPRHNGEMLKKCL
ncbi:hypothetical protein V3C99_010483 [Haemonchus contortus]